MRVFLATVFVLVTTSVLVIAADSTAAVQATESPLLIGSGYGVYGLVLWLSADSGVKMDKDNNVYSLTDRSGNFVLTASDPDRRPAYVPNILNGKPVLRFYPDQSLYSDDEFGTVLDHAMTMIVVAKTDASPTFLQYPLYLGQNRQSYANRALAYDEGKQIFDGQWVVFFGPPVVRKSFVMLGVTVNDTLTKAVFYQNGTLVTECGLSDRNGKATFEGLSHGITLGAAADPCRGWLGDIAEVLVFEHQLSAAEMQTIWASLSSKYGLSQAAAISN